MQNPLRVSSSVQSLKTFWADISVVACCTKMSLPPLRWLRHTSNKMVSLGKFGDGEGSVVFLVMFLVYNNRQDTLRTIWTKNWYRGFCGYVTTQLQSHILLYLYQQSGCVVTGTRNPVTTHPVCLMVRNQVRTSVKSVGG